jgi:hypothetical protein
MARASLIVILVATLLCAVSGDRAPANETATPGAVAGVGGGGPVSVRSSPIAAIV